MKKLPIALLILLHGLVGWAQSSGRDQKYSLKLYNLSTIENLEDNSLMNQNTSTQVRRFLHPTIAFQWSTPKKNYHEIELSDWMIQQYDIRTEEVSDTIALTETVSGSNTTTSSISFRYEFIWNPRKPKSEKLRASLGFGIQPYFNAKHVSPVVSHSFPTSEMALGFRTQLIPRVTYSLSKKWYIEANIQIHLSNTDLKSTEVENPAFSPGQRKEQSLNLDLFPAYFSGRVGVGMIL